ncbi:MAG TPA: glycosyltransferase, partial [Flavobacteriales bacterium]|nr:glycosyltransferase [Flavobacteriales bacterium]
MAASSLPPEAPLVSVVVVTYQHAAYIERCLRSILEQRCTFAWELLVGEDGSTDGTRAICERLAAEFPDRIRLFLRERKDVLVIMGRPTGRANLLALFNAARGKYIAICEGDDHWIDADKLQLQVDAMEGEPSLSGCFTNAWNQRNGEREDYYAHLQEHRPPRDTQAEDVVFRIGVPTCTILFRRELIFPLHPAYYRSPVADRILLAGLTAHGPLRFIDRFTGVREVHPGGIHSMKGELHDLKMKVAVVPFVDELSG